MALTLINPSNSANFNDFIGENYQLALNQLIQDLFDSNGRDLSAYASAFFDLIQARDDPPLETIWVYSALTFRQINTPKDEPLNRVSAAKDLFQLISGCSASCSPSKSIGLLAPVMYELSGVVADLKGKKDSGSKREKKLMREIKSLVSEILAYCSLCCSAIDDDGLGPDSDSDSDSDDGFVRPLEDLIRFWIGSGADEALKAKEMFRLFFPFVGDDIAGRVGVEGSVRELAGVVVAEAFLSRLCLDIISGVSNQDLQKELRIWAVGSITGLRHFHFFEMLVRMLLEQTLLVTSMLSSEDEISLRKILYDAVVLVDYSFLRPDNVYHLPAKRVKSLAIARVLVTNEAIELFRRKGDQTKAISYINAFSSSQLPPQLIKLVTNEIGSERRAGQPKGLSPKALLKWLLNLENQGIRLFDDDLENCRSRLALDISVAAQDQQAYKSDGTKPDADLLFYIDNKGEGEDGSEDDERTKESVSAAFVAAAHTMTSAENGGGSKRKKNSSDEKNKQVKFLKHTTFTSNSRSSGVKSTFHGDDGSSSGSEVEDPISDKDIEEKEK